MGIDYAIRKDESPAITDDSSPTTVALYEQWEQSNQLSVMFIKIKILVEIRGSINQHVKVRHLLKVIDDRFITSYKALASILIMKFSSFRLTSVKGVYEYIMQMQDISAQLKKLEVDMSESFLIHFILNIVPPEYGL